MKKLLSLIALISLGILGSSSWAQPIVIFGDEDYPPIIFAKDGKPSGILPDILSRIEQQTDSSFQLVLLPWKRAYVEALEGRGGIIGLSKNAERLEIFDYSELVYNDDILLVTHRSNPLSFETLSDLHGKRIGVQIGASYGDAFASAVKANQLEIMETSDLPKRLRLLLIGKLDAVMVGNGLQGLERVVKGDPFIEQNQYQMMVLPKPFAIDPLFLGFNKKMKMRLFLDGFNAALKKIG